MVVLAGGIFVMQMFAGGPPPEGVPDPSKVTSLELKITGRMIVGIKALSAQSPGLEDQIEPQLTELADTLTVDDPNIIDTPAGFIDRVRTVRGHPRRPRNQVCLNQ